MHKPSRFLLLSLLVWGCSEATSEGIAEPAWHGQLGVPQKLELISNLPFVDLVVNDGEARARAFVDSGSPVTFLDSELLAGREPEHVDLTLGRVHLQNLQVFPFDLTDGSGSFEVGGLIGHNVLRAFVCAFNYRDRELTLLESATSTSASAIAFELKGGGTGRVTFDSDPIDLPESRGLVTVVIGQARHRMMLDTGASFTAVRTSVFDEHLEDASLVRQAPSLSTLYGSIDPRAMRLAQATIGSVPVSEQIVIDGIDDLLDRLEAEVGEPLDGVVGGNWLREFFVEIDYREARLFLTPYSDRRHIRDEWKKVGVELDGGLSEDGRLRVALVHDASNASEVGLKVGDVIVEVDGISPSFPHLDGADTLLRGAVGTRKALKIAREPRGESEVLSVMVDDLLPVQARQ